MDDESKLGEECTRYRSAFEDCRDEAWADDHRRQCAPCALWAAQSAQIGALARGMPQFDVPESLTQRILSAVELERNVARSVPQYLLPGALTIGVVVALTALPFEPIEGIISWVCGIMAVCLLKVVVCSGKAHQESHTT